MIEKTQRFFNQQSLDLVTKLASSRETSYFKNYPLLLDHSIKPASAYSSFSLKAKSKKQYANTFKDILGYLSNPRSLQAQKQGFFAKLFTPTSPQKMLHMEPNLVRGLKTLSNFQQMVLQIDNIDKDVQILETKLLESIQIRGAFIHRSLNLPAHCYSVQRDDRKKFIVFRLRKKLHNSEDIGQLNKRVQMFENEDIPNYLDEGSPLPYRLFYMDTYKDFLQNELLVRELVVVSTSIKGRLYNKITKQTINLPLHPSNSVTTHALQIEKIRTPNMADECVVADLDFFMKGNPYMENL